MSNLVTLASLFDAESNDNSVHASKNRKIGQKSRCLYRVMNTPIKTLYRILKSDKDVHMISLIITLLPLSGYDRVGVHVRTH